MARQTPMNRLAVTLITKNEERNLPRVLASLEDLADELVVVDSGSSDRTLEIVTAQGAKIYMRGLVRLCGPAQFRRRAMHVRMGAGAGRRRGAKRPLRASLRYWKERPAEFDAYEFARCANYLGTLDPPLRLVSGLEDPTLSSWRRSICRRYPRCVSHRLGPWGALQGTSCTTPLSTPEEHEATVQSYSTSAAAELFANGRHRWRASHLRRTCMDLCAEDIASGRAF